MKLPKCAVRTCLNEADPRWFVRDANDRAVMICDGHEQAPRPEEVEPAPVPAAIATGANGGRAMGETIASHLTEDERRTLFRLLLLLEGNQRTVEHAALSRLIQLPATRALSRSHVEEVVAGVADAALRKLYGCGAGFDPDTGAARTIRAIAVEVADRLCPRDAVWWFGDLP